MHRPLLVAVVALVAAAAPFAARGQDAGDHSFRAAKVGDYATYALSLKVGAAEVKGTVTHTVTARTEKEATVAVTGKMGGKELPPRTQTIDLTRPFDPTAAGASPGARGDAKVEKIDEAKEKFSAGGKDYDATRTTYKVTTRGAAGEVTSEVKAWTGKDIPLGLGKLEITGTSAGMPMRVQMELAESGSKK